MTSQVLNFLWLNLDIPPLPDPEDGSIREPLPARYIENTRKAGEAHPEAQIVLWVDSKRLTEKQMAYLKTSIEDGRANVHLQDLRDIPAYDQEPLYDKAETNSRWRNGEQDTLIWRQVDAAKILLSLQANFDQTFFADLDHSHLDIGSAPVQEMIEKHGLLIGSYSGDAKYLHIENQLWGFNRSRREFFEQYYVAALESAHKGQNGFNDLAVKVKYELIQGEGLLFKDFCLPIDDDGTRAEQPGHKWRGGFGEEPNRPSLISADKLAGVFNKNSVRNDKNANPSAVKHKATPALNPHTP